MYLATLKTFFEEHEVTAESLVHPWKIKKLKKSERATTGAIKAIAKALQIYPSAIHQWNGVVPVMRAHMVVNLTRGSVALNPEAYEQQLAECTKKTGKKKRHSAKRRAV